MIENKRSIPNSWFYFAVLILGAYFIIKLIDQSKMISIFPFDYTNDYSSHMAQLYFLGQCGFHKLCPYWYNGYVLFKSYSPTFFVFTNFLFVSWTNNIQLSTYLGVVSTMALIFATIFYFGKLFKLSVVKRILFFLFIMANPMSIGNFIRLGRVGELAAWCAFFPLAFFVLWYKDKPFDKKFIFFIPLYFLIMLSHPTVIILAHVMLLSLFLVVSNKDKIKLVIYGAVGAVLSSFWWLGFLINLSNNFILSYKNVKRVLDLSGPWLLTNIAGFIVPIALWATFYWYYKYKATNKRKELIFALPILISSAIYFFKLVPFVPLFKHVYPDTFLLFFLFYTVFYLLKIRFNKLNKKERWFILISLILIPIIAVAVSLVHTPWFNDKKDPIAEETISLFPNIPISEKYIITYCSDEGCCKVPSCRIPAIDSYAPIAFNISTASGYTPEEINKDYIDILSKAMFLKNDKSCKEYLEELDFLNTTYVISYNDLCDYHKKCGFTEIDKREHACLMKV